MLTVTPDAVTVRLSTFEKLAAFHGDLTVPRSAIVGVNLVHDPMGDVKGFRAPGYSLPGHAKIGTWHRREGRDFVAVHANRPGVELRLTGQPYQRVLITTDDPYAVAAQLS